MISLGGLVVKFSRTLLNFLKKKLCRTFQTKKRKRNSANIIPCIWCFTLLMNLHDFVAEPVNPVHSFHDAHTVPFCLTADHISTCLMMSSARFKPAQFWSVLILGEWKCSICSYQRRLVWRTVTENWCGQSVWWKRGSFHGAPWTAQFWMRGWWSVSTAGYGCSGAYRLTVSRQLVLECPALWIK